MIYITDDIGTIVQQMRSGFYENYYEPNYTSSNGSPFYLFGHRIEINNILMRQNRDAIKKNQKYPLIALRWETTEQVRGDFRDLKLNLVIADYTDKNYLAADRMENVFKPVLYPLYEAFMKSLINSGLFTWPDDELWPPHTKIDRPYFGTQSGSADTNKKNIFDDPVDAIEIIDLAVSRVETTC